MTKITRSKDSNQLRITIPQDIIDLTNWDEGTEIIFVPYIKEPKEPLDENTPILLKAKIKSKKR